MWQIDWLTFAILKFSLKNLPVFHNLIFCFGGKFKCGRWVLIRHYFLRKSCLYKMHLCHDARWDAILSFIQESRQDQTLKKQVAGEVKTCPFVKGYTKIAFKKVTCLLDEIFPLRGLWKEVKQKYKRRTRRTTTTKEEEEKSNSNK